MQPKHINHVRAVLVGMALCLSWSAGATETYRWVQHVPGGFEARAISENGVCPAALVDGAAVAMGLRSTPGEQYPITVCALPLPPATQRLQIGDTAMVLPRTSPQRILVIGDTGCRLKGKRVQACNDPVAWPFRAGAAHVAQLKPDLIVHVGDFHYRESPCPEGNSGCAGTPYGDTWAVWKEDFFSPVGKLCWCVAITKSVIVAAAVGHARWTRMRGPPIVVVCRRPSLISLILAAWRLR